MGNPRLRAALVELAWRLVRFQRDYKAVRKWRHILAKEALATGAARKKAIVAVARQSEEPLENKTNEQIRKKKRPREKLQPAINKAYELTTTYTTSARHT